MLKNWALVNEFNQDSFSCGLCTCLQCTFMVASRTCYLMNVNFWKLYCVKHKNTRQINKLKWKKCCSLQLACLLVVSPNMAARLGRHFLLMTKRRSTLEFSAISDSTQYFPKSLCTMSYNVFKVYIGRRAIGGLFTLYRSWLCCVSFSFVVLRVLSIYFLIAFYCGCKENQKIPGVKPPPHWVVFFVTFEKQHGPEA